jgi:hypothetical protein
MKENHFLDDGAYSAVQIIIETVRRRLAGEGDIAVELLKDLKEPKDASEFRMKITVIHLSLLCLRASGGCACPLHVNVLCAGLPPQEASVVIAEKREVSFFLMCIV